MSRRNSPGLTMWFRAADAADAKGKKASDPCLSFTSTGPHRLPIRPELLSVGEGDVRVYSASVRQVRKMCRLIREAEEAEAQRERDMSIEPLIRKVHTP